MPSALPLQPPLRQPIAPGHFPGIAACGGDEARTFAAAPTTPLGQTSPARPPAALVNFPLGELSGSTESLTPDAPPPRQPVPPRCLTRGGTHWLGMRRGRIGLHSDA